MIKALFSFFMLAKLCCTNTTHAADENSAPPSLDTSPNVKIAPRKESVDGSAVRKDAHPQAGLTEDQKSILRNIGISEDAIIRIDLAQKLLHKSPQGKLQEPGSYFSSEELSKIIIELESAGSANPENEIREVIDLIKGLYPDKIHLTDLNANTIYTPAARAGGKSNRFGMNICAQVAQTNLHLGHVNGLTFRKPEEPPETEDQRTARKSMQAALFKELEASRGVTPENLSQQLNNIENAWHSYFEYFRVRIENIENHNAPKITANEIKDVFIKCVSQYYTKLEIDGYALFFNKEEVDLDRTLDGITTNKDLMKVKRAPFCSAGLSMNLHHLTRRQPGVIVLLPESFHTKYFQLLHFKSEAHMRQPAPIDRNDFAIWKKQTYLAIYNHLVPAAASPVRTQVVTELFAED